MHDATLPSWLAPWCLRVLGSAPADVLLFDRAVSDVVALRLDDGRDVVVKAREDEAGRAVQCVTAQAELARLGFPCAAPLTDVTIEDGLAVHAETWRPGGEVDRNDDEGAAHRSAALLAELLRRLAMVSIAPPVPNPEWVRWDHEDDGLFPRNPKHDVREASIAVPRLVLDTARRARARLRAATEARVLGHADWEAQNLRWRGAKPHAVHDWDSLAWLTEAAIVGAASGAFASAETPKLVSVESSSAFLDGYERAAGRTFSADEREVAWAASLWPALHNARCETLYRMPTPLCSRALDIQAEDRLSLAGA